jgi:hypothetical protein
VRFRITPAELETLERGESVREDFPLGEGWHAAIVPRSDITALQFSAGVLEILVSEDDRAALSDSENEGVYFQTDAAPAVRYLIEKDFPCAHPRASEAAEPVTQTFSAPTGFEERKNKISL